MIEFPNATVAHRRMPKDALYKHLTLTSALKEKFVSDVDRIFVENCLTKESLNLADDSEIAEIDFLSISLKKQELDGKVLEAIARQNPHKLVFLLMCGDSWQLALYHGKLYRSPWIDREQLDLELDGTNLGEIWESFVEQVALRDEQAGKAESLSIEERLDLQEDIMKLQKLIAKTEAAAWKEQQPKKQYELYARLQEYRRKLEELQQHEHKKQSFK
ncbi:MAG: DUF4391 domain-containing protein [Clostridiales bacterium]|nr:DUF4391 domain-containing protein [Clostridiales bacterium]